MTELPADVVEIIFEALDAVDDLRACRAVNSRWCDAVSAVAARLMAVTTSGVSTAGRDHERPHVLPRLTAKSYRTLARFSRLMLVDATTELTLAPLEPEWSLPPFAVGRLANVTSARVAVTRGESDISDGLAAAASAAAVLRELPALESVFGFWFFGGR
jgi:hypothetical protein